MDLTSFSHGQIKSKIWLCDTVRDFLPENANVHILGSWYNVLGALLFIKYPDKINSVVGIDINKEAIDIAEKITSYWYLEGKINNICDNANTYKIPTNETTVVINCSPEHFESKEWLANVEDGTLVCIQSSNIIDPNDPWFITQPSATFDDFMNNYPLKSVLFSGTLKIEYSHFSYDRYMVIGRK